MNNFHNTAKCPKIKGFTPFFIKCGDFFKDFCLTENALKNYSRHATANSVAEPRNSNDISVADKCTPLNACFFMRSTNTPKERLKMACSSMVACYGKGFALCCVPLIAVFEPVTRYRPKASKLQAVTSQHLFSGVTAMIYKFLLLGTRLHISTYAQSEAAARQFLNLPRDKAAFIARIKGVKNG